jgi:coenzyme F420 biosynthesis associated uncharacterized protein
MVDWGLARQIARIAAGSPPQGPLPADLDSLAAMAEREVGAYTGLRLDGEPPPPEALDRAAWAEVNVDALSRLLGPAIDRMGGQLDSTGPLAGPLRGAAGLALAAETGLVVGYLSQRVLGQFEVSLLEPEVAPRLLFVAPNLVEATRRMEVDPERFLTWVVFHEVTHVFQFGGVPWLREHLAGLLREYLATVEVQMGEGMRGLSSLPSPAKLVEAFREGGLAGLVQTEEQRGITDRIQATMAVIEGYSEHVMDALGERHISGYEDLRTAMERRRRERSAPERILQRLLGLDLKLRQYELGHEFCDAVAAEEGIGGLNAVWSAPEALPTAAELEDPPRWIERVGRRRALPA